VLDVRTESVADYCHGLTNGLVRGQEVMDTDDRCHAGGTQTSASPQRFGEPVDEMGPVGAKNQDIVRLDVSQQSKSGTLPPASRSLTSWHHA
jgi:hypothetical protein